MAVRTFSLNISLDDDMFMEPGFGEYDAKQEVARLLRYAALSVGEDLRSRGDLRDVNGNRVGTYEISEGGDMPTG